MPVPHVNWGADSSSYQDALLWDCAVVSNEELSAWVQGKCWMEIIMKLITFHRNTIMLAWHFYITWVSQHLNIINNCFTTFLLHPLFHRDNYLCVHTWMIYWPHLLEISTVVTQLLTKKLACTNSYQRNFWAPVCGGLYGDNHSGLLKNLHSCS